MKIKYRKNLKLFLPFKIIQLLREIFSILILHQGTTSCAWRTRPKLNSYGDKPLLHLNVKQVTREGDIAGTWEGGGGCCVNKTPHCIFYACASTGDIRNTVAANHRRLQTIQYAFPLINSAKEIAAMSRRIFKILYKLLSGRHAFCLWSGDVQPLCVSS
jgi:hypothetical protein